MAGATITSVYSVTTSTPSSSTTSTASTAFYLDLGTSVSVGVQPTSTDPSGKPTDHGYANALVAIEATRGIALQLTRLGCPGESLLTMMKGGDRCHPLPDTQLAEAVAFLHAHLHEDGLVTKDLDFDTLHPCFRQLIVDQVCVNTKLDLIRQQLVQILTTLRAVAGARAVSPVAASWALLNYLGQDGYTEIMRDLL